MIPGAHTAATWAALNHTSYPPPRLCSRTNPRDQLAKKVDAARHPCWRRKMKAETFRPRLSHFSANSTTARDDLPAAAHYHAAALGLAPVGVPRVAHSAADETSRAADSADGFRSSVGPADDSD
jgi:hypothetical protein